MLKLGQNEKILRSYDYGTTNEGGKENLTITNKRIVITRTGRNRIFSEEMRTEDVRRISSGMEIIEDAEPKTGSGKVAGIIFAIIFILLAIGISFVNVLPGVLLGIVGLVIFFAAIFSDGKPNISREVKFYLLFETADPEGMKVKISEGNPEINFLRFDVNEEAVKALMEEVGALLLDCRA